MEHISEIYMEYMYKELYTELCRADDRQLSFRLEDIYKRDPELHEWWVREKK